MGSERLKTLLSELDTELQQLEDVDPETLRMLNELGADIESVASPGAAERARQLETRFAAEHPVLERIARELADTLAKMGI
ncbi:MAG: DUF4404 family protein [Pseudomonadota bacterium]